MKDNEKQIAKLRFFNMVIYKERDSFTCQSNFYLEYKQDKIKKG